MRISDWSSDVCSSDLLRQRRQRQGYVGRRGPAPFGEPGVRPADARHRELPRGPGGGERRQPSGKRLAAAAGLPQPLRSEEHTSELQSLMRISYAVFCLKKQTNEEHL